MDAHRLDEAKLKADALAHPLVEYIISGMLRHLGSSILAK